MDGHQPAGSTAHGPWSVDTGMRHTRLRCRHGPSAALPGYPMYYLNVMAGPHAERAWRITDDPAHAWVRETWDGARAVSGAPSTEGAA